MCCVPSEQLLCSGEVAAAVSAATRKRFFGTRTRSGRVSPSWPRTRGLPPRSLQPALRPQPQSPGSCATGTARPGVVRHCPWGSTGVPDDLSGGRPSSIVTTSLRNKPPETSVVDTGGRWFLFTCLWHPKAGAPWAEFRGLGRSHSAVVSCGGGEWGEHHPLPTDGSSWSAGLFLRPWRVSTDGRGAGAPDVQPRNGPLSRTMCWGPCGGWLRGPQSHIWACVGGRRLGPLVPSTLQIRGTCAT